MNRKHLLATLVVGVVAMAAAGCAELGDIGRGGNPGGEVTPTSRATAQPTGHRKPTPATSSTQGTLNEPDLIAKVKPSVVHLAGSNGSGSGVVVDARRGLVLTNAHVIFGQQGLRARVGDDPGSETAAQLVAAAPCEDLAVVRLVNRPPSLQAIRFGDSSTVRPGDHVTVLGYPVSFEEQASAGILAQQVVATEGSVSVANVVATPDPSLPRYASTIQHQAPVNHGNSGGPLVDDRGRLVGINSLGNFDAQGQYYAISVNRVRQVLPDLLAGRSQANLGWEMAPVDRVDLPAIFADDQTYAGQGGSELGRQVADRIDQEGIEGMYLLATEPGSPVQDANIFAGNLVTSIAGQPVGSVQDVCDLVLDKRPGDTVRVTGRYLDSAPEAGDILAAWETEVVVR